MSIEITFVRHAETDANVTGVWQGHGHHLLSAAGLEQARALGERLAGKEFDQILVSDLARTMQTAEVAGLNATPDPVWREIDIGRWQGLTRSEVHEVYPDEMAALRRGEPVAMGGGESWDGFAARVQQAVEDLVARTPAGSRVLVLTHGGNIHATIGAGFAFAERRGMWPLERVRNASVTEAILSPGSFHLQVYNDARHAGLGAVHAGSVALVRHAETQANLEGRWYGRTDGPLSDGGRSQAAAFAGTPMEVDRVYASPLERTMDTARAFAAARGLEVAADGDLVEIFFGAWEAMTTSEIAGTYPEEFADVFERRNDTPRGGSGESFGSAARRMSRAVERIKERHRDERVAVFTHGGVIWALAARILGLGWERHQHLSIPGNTSVTQVEVTPEGLRLVDYNLPPR